MGVTDKIFQLARSIFSFHVEVFFLLGMLMASLVKIFFSGSCTTDSKLVSKQLEKCVATWKLVFIFKSCDSLAVTHDMKWPEAMCYVTGSRFKSFVCFIIEEPGVPVIDFKIGALSIAGQKI